MNTSKTQPPAAGAPMSTIVISDFVAKLAQDGAMTFAQAGDLMAIVKEKDEQHAALVAALEAVLGCPDFNPVYDSIAKVREQARAENKALRDAITEAFWTITNVWGNSLVLPAARKTQIELAINVLRAHVAQHDSPGAATKENK